MADAAHSFVAGDDASVLRVTCKNKGTGLAVDLTGSTVKLKWQNRRGVLQTKEMSLEDATNGVAIYQFAAGELEFPNMKFEVEITDGTSKVFRSLDVLYELVREKFK